MKNKYKMEVTENTYKAEFRVLQVKCQEARLSEINKLEEKGHRLTDIVLVEYTGYPVFNFKRISPDKFHLECEDRFEVKVKSPQDKGLTQTTMGVWKRLMPL